MYAISSLRWVHGVGVSRTKSNRIAADLIWGTLQVEMELSPFMFEPEREISESDCSDVVKNTNRCLVHFPHLPLNASH